MDDLVAALFVIFVFLGILFVAVEVTYHAMVYLNRRQSRHRRRKGYYR